MELNTFLPGYTFNLYSLSTVGVDSRSFQSYLKKILYFLSAIRVEKCSVHSYLKKIKRLCNLSTVRVDKSNSESYLKENEDATLPANCQS